MGNYDYLFFEARLLSFLFSDLTAETHLVASFDEFCAEHVDMIFYTSHVWVEKVRYHAARCRLNIVDIVCFARGTRTRWLIVPFFSEALVVEMRNSQVLLFERIFFKMQFKFIKKKKKLTCRFRERGSGQQIVESSQ